MLIIIGILISTFGLIFTGSVKSLEHITQPLGLAFFGASAIAFLILFIGTGPNKSWSGLTRDGKTMLIGGSLSALGGLISTLAYAAWRTGFINVPGVL